MNIETAHRRILLTGARAPVTLELARLFAKAGHTVFTADSIRNHGCRFSRAVKRSFRIAPPRHQPDRFIQDLLRVIQTEQIDLLLPTCEEIFYIAAALDELTPYCRVLTEPLAMLGQLHDKERFIQLIQSYGLPVPKTERCDSIACVDRALRAWPSKRAVVLKPVFSRFGSRVKILYDRKNPLAEDEISPATPWLLQEYIAGNEYATYSLVDYGKVVAHTTYAGSFRAGVGAQIAFAHQKSPQIESWVAEVARRLHFTGQIAFDLVETAEGTIYPLECNPRATSGIHLLAERPDFATAFFQQPATSIQPENAKAMLSAAMWLYGLPGVRSKKRLGEWIQTMRSSRDVLFRREDPLPMLAQGFTLLSFLQRSLRHKVSLLGATTQDIEWNGEVR